MKRGQFGTLDNWRQDNLAHRTIWHRYVKEDNLAPRTIWNHNEKRTIWQILKRGQHGTQDNLAPQWKEDNLAHRTIWHLGQFGTQDNLAPRTIWHLGQFGTRTIWPLCKRVQFGTIMKRGQYGTVMKRGQYGTQDNLAPPSLSQWAEFRTCVASRLASLFLWKEIEVLRDKTRLGELLQY